MSLQHHNYDIQPHIISGNSADNYFSLLPGKQTVIHGKNYGVNPMVDAASGIFRLLGQVKQLETYYKLNTLHQDLIKEIKNFQDHAKSSGYSSEQILLARYALCATCDDIISKQSWAGNDLWRQYSLLHAFHPEHAVPERFFVILARLSLEASLCIDVLELMYLCLSLGFSGHCGLSSGDNTMHTEAQLTKITEDLYQLIRSYRGEVNKALSPAVAKAYNTKYPRYKNRIDVIKKTAILTSIIIGMTVIFLGGSALHQINSLQQEISAIMHT